MKGAKEAAASLRTAAMVLPMMASLPATAQPEGAGQPASGSGIAESAGTGAFSRAQQSPARYTLTPQRPELACEALRSRPAPADVTILSANARPAADGVPAYCRVRGVIAPEVQFDVSLPEAWNRRFYMFGNGGYAGEDLDRPSRQDTRNAELAAGFAVADTNTGHDADREPLGTFAASLPKLIDYAFRAVHRTAEEAKRTIASYYGRPAALSYWNACSTGGRQGLMSAQRFPNDFDGMLAGAPVSNFVDTMVNYIWNGRALEGAGLTAGKMELVADASRARCDAKDGLEDGLVADPRRCDFDPRRDVERYTAGQDGDKLPNQGAGRCDRGDRPGDPPSGRRHPLPRLCARARGWLVGLDARAARRDLAPDALRPDLPAQHGVRSPDPGIRPRPSRRRPRSAAHVGHFDGMTALINWVENGIAPDSIPAAQAEDGRIVRTRPLCPYP